MGPNDEGREGRTADGGREELREELLPQAEGAEVGDADETDLPWHDQVSEEMREQ